MKDLIVLTTALLLLLLGLAAPARALNEWTVAVYAALDDGGSSALEDAGIQSMNELAEIGSQNKVELVAQADRSPDQISDLQRRTYKDPTYRGAMRYVAKGRGMNIFKRGEWVEDEPLGEVNMGSPQVFWDFLKWVSEKHAAKHYFIVIAGKGGGIFSSLGKGNAASWRPGSVDFDPDRFVAYDEASSDCLTVFELAAVLEAFRERLNGGRRIDVMAFDSDLTATIEVLYQLRGSVSVVVGSAATMPSSGLAYDAIARTALKNPGVKAEDLAKAAVTSCVRDASRADEDSVLGAFRAGESVEELVSAFANFSKELRRAFQLTWFWETCRIFEVPDYGDGHRYWDVARLGRSVEKGTVDLKQIKLPFPLPDLPSIENEIRDEAKQLLQALKACTVAVQASGQLRTDGVGGLSVAAPLKKGDYKAVRGFYKNLDFARDTLWDEVLDKGRLRLGL